jgi:glycerophosphoryl diester phosphodiesterase
MITVIKGLCKKRVNMKQIIGHRGASAYAPENTMAAFNKALSLGCRFVEFDVMLSADGHPFVFHDESLRRTTNGRGEFGLMPADYIESLDSGKWFSKRFSNERIPTFQCVLEWLLANDVDANIEIKPYPGKVEETSAAVLTYLNRFWPADKKLPLISSFNSEALIFCRSLSPEMPLGLLMDKWEKDWLVKAQKLDCFSVHLSRRTVTEARIHEIKSHGFSVYVYTVNTKRKALKFFSWGVDAIFSDYPDLLGMVPV